MRKATKFLRLSIVVFLCLGIIGCVSIPKGFLKPSEGYLQKRELQTRQYDTTNEEQIITAIAGVLQDLGFTLDASETKLGLVSASKASDAKSGSQIAGAVILDIIAAALGSSPNATGMCDKNQTIKASVITSLALNGKKTTVRVTFQRIVVNMNNLVGRMETIAEPEMYQKFYDSLSKAIFLEAQKI